MCHSSVRNGDKYVGSNLLRILPGILSVLSSSIALESESDELQLNGALSYHPSLCDVLSTHINHCAPGKIPC